MYTAILCFNLMFYWPQPLQMPPGEVVFTGMRDNRAVVCVEADVAAPMITRQFRLIPDGHVVPPTLVHQGSFVLNGSYIWSVYETQ